MHLEISFWSPRQCTHISAKAHSSTRGSHVPHQGAAVHKISNALPVNKCTQVQSPVYVPATYWLPLLARSVASTHQYHPCFRWRRAIWDVRFCTWYVAYRYRRYPSCHHFRHHLYLAWFARNLSSSSCVSLCTRCRSMASNTSACSLSLSALCSIAFPLKRDLSSYNVSFFSSSFPGALLSFARHFSINLAHALLIFLAAVAASFCRPRTGEIAHAFGVLLLLSIRWMCTSSACFSSSILDLSASAFAIALSVSSLANARLASLSSLSHVDHNFHLALHVHAHLIALVPQGDRCLSKLLQYSCSISLHYLRCHVKVTRRVVRNNRRIL